MKKIKITPYLRGRAARLCSIAASTPGFAITYGWVDVFGDTPTVDEIGSLALAAWLASSGDPDWAEAEALLRTGWTP